MAKQRSYGVMVEHTKTMTNLRNICPNVGATVSVPFIGCKNAAVQWSVSVFLHFFVFDVSRQNIKYINQSNVIGWCHE